MYAGSWSFLQSSRDGHEMKRVWREAAQSESYSWYCWWKKSCTCWYRDPIIKYFLQGFLYIPGGCSGFLSSTATTSTRRWDPGLALCEVWHSCCGSFFSLKHFPSLNSCGLQYDLDSIWFINAVVAKSKSSWLFQDFSNFWGPLVLVTFRMSCPERALGIAVHLHMCLAGEDAFSWWGLLVKLILFGIQLESFHAPK